MSSKPAAAHFDLIFARDILHHVDISQTMRELSRVAKPGAIFVADEIYSHSMTDRISHAKWVDTWLYPRIQAIIYGDEKPYITADERKMTELDIQLVKESLATIEREKYFNFLITRVLPNTNIFFSKIDRALLSLVGRKGGSLLAGRILLMGTTPRRVISLNQG